jgi:hypothetical protein
LHLDFDDRFLEIGLIVVLLFFFFKKLRFALITRKKKSGKKLTSGQHYPLAATVVDATKTPVSWSFTFLKDAVDEGENRTGDLYCQVIIGSYRASQDIAARPSETVGEDNPVKRVHTPTKLVTERRGLRNRKQLLRL